MELKFQPHANLPPITSINSEEPESVGIIYENSDHARLFYRYNPISIIDPENSGMFSNIKSAVYKSPPAFCIAANNVKLIGYRTLIIQDRYFCDDEMSLSKEDIERKLSVLTKSGSFENEDTGLSRISSEEFELDESTFDHRSLSGLHVILGSHEPSNYGSFLFRVLPKILSIKDHGLHDVPAVVWAQIEPFIVLLELCGIKRANIVQHQTKCITSIDRVVFPSLRNPHGYLDARSRDFFTWIGDKVGRSKLKRKIYVSRQGHARAGGSSRVMLNEGDLILALSSLGFEIIEPEKLSIIDQIKTFNSADFVIGPSGSAMFNCVFCSPGTKVIDIESEPHWIYAHTGIFSSCGLEYSIVTGMADRTDERPVHKQWNVNIDSLLKLINSML
jgi:capsular polysaccharide biosynthesis protein